MTELRSVLDFPVGKPEAYIRLDDEPTFDAGKHLALSPPAQVISLADLGYSQAELNAAPSPLALTSAFRIFSDEGLAIMQMLCARMKSNRNAAAGTGDNRLGSYIRGAGYRSRFIRDFCECHELLNFLSTLAGAPLARHSVPAVACGINYAPEDVRRAIDSWHVDSVAFDAVILLTDPATFSGGEFQYFYGTKAEGELLSGASGESGTTSELPPERVRTMNFPAAGFGFLQQGNKVFHRACRLLAPAERITVIPSFVTLADDKTEGTNTEAMSHWQDPGILTELARHEAWLADHRLRQLMNRLPLTATVDEIATALSDAADGLNRFAAQLRDQVKC